MRFWKRRREAKLYRQWVERAGLPPETVPREADKSEEVHAQTDNRKAVSPKATGPVRVQPGSSAVTHAEVTGDMMAEIDRRQPRSPMLYILLGASLVALFVVLILLIVSSC